MRQGDPLPESGAAALATGIPSYPRLAVQTYEASGGPEALLGLGDLLGGGVDLAPEAGLGIVALAGGVEGAGELGPARGRLGGQRRLGRARPPRGSAST